MNRKLLIGCIALILMSLLSAFGFSTKLDYPLKKMENDINNPYKISTNVIFILFNELKLKKKPPL
jgi:hypothetical protein